MSPVEDQRFLEIGAYTVLPETSVSNEPVASLSSVVVVVTGASRGLGKGIALALGTKGATVYVTGRSTTSGDSTLPGSIHETARAVTEAGGTGIAIACDHAQDEQVRALFDRIAQESGRLDILVNNVAAIHPDLILPGPFWTKSIELAEIIDVGLRSQYIASYYAAPLIIKQGRGLVANISFYGSVSYYHGPAYGAQKAGIDKMTADMAVDFRPCGVAAVSIWPGMVATEFSLKVVAENPAYRNYSELFETPEFTGLVIDALYQDRNVMSISGQALIGAECALKYGFRDINGRQPASYRHSLGHPRDLHLSHVAPECEE